MENNQFLASSARNGRWDGWPENDCVRLPHGRRTHAVSPVNPLAIKCRPLLQRCEYKLQAHKKVILPSEKKRARIQQLITWMTKLLRRRRKYTNDHEIRRFIPPNEVWMRTSSRVYECRLSSDVSRNYVTDVTRNESLIAEKIAQHSM